MGSEEAGERCGSPAEQRSDRSRHRAPAVLGFVLVLIGSLALSAVAAATSSVTQVADINPGAGASQFKAR